jgi:alkaline phosphatase
MKRRSFLTNATIAAGTIPFVSCAPKTVSNLNGLGKGKKPKNIIFLVSDGMSTGTLNMADLMLQRRDGTTSHWLDLYRNQRVNRGLMDMASASSMITDSSAASSSWGGGHRVKNGRINYSESGEEYTPIWQKMKAAGKKVGCVTTVPITHATPAGFCVSSKSRGEQSEIAEKYLGLKFDVMMGGGEKYFADRKDGRNLFDEYRKAGYSVVRDSIGLNSVDSGKPILGVFAKDGLPYEIDRKNDPILSAKVPSLANMTQRAIQLMADHDKGFCLQVEGGKVDWAAHANDAPALIFDQIAFDEAIKVAIDFAEKDGNTLVVITTDHGNANPGLYYGDKSDDMFISLANFKQSNDWVLMGIKTVDTSSQIAERILQSQGYALKEEQLSFLIKKYSEQNSDGVYNAYKLPFKEYAEFQRNFTAIGFGGMDHSADFVELCMFGPGSEHMPSFMRNTDMHTFLLQAVEVG